MRQRGRIYTYEFNGFSPPLMSFSSAWYDLGIRLSTLLTGEKATNHAKFVKHPFTPLSNLPYEPPTFFATGCKLNRLISLMSSSFDQWAFRSSGVVSSGRQQRLHEDLFTAWLSQFQTLCLCSDFWRGEHFYIRDIYYFHFTVFLSLASLRWWWAELYFVNLHFFSCITHL